MVLYEVLARGAASHGERPAIYYHDQEITYGDLLARVNRTAGAFASLGLGRGDRIALYLPNCPEFTIAYYAAAALGAIAVPANPLLKPAELSHIWGDSHATLVIAALPMLANAQEAAAQTPSVQRVVCVGPREAVSASVTTFRELEASGSDAAPRGPAPHASDPAVFIYTSGTTGRPKGAVLSHDNLLANCRQIQGVLRFTATDNLLCVLPLFHSFAGTVCQNASLYSGARTTMLEQFIPARVVEAIVRRRVTLFPGVPAMYGALLQFPPDQAVDFSSVRLCVSGGAPMPVALMEAFERRFGTVIIEGDGPTECSPVTSVNPPDGVRKPGSIGLPVSDVDMRIFDDLDRELPVGEVGEIVVRGPNVMIGYHNQPEATAEAMRNGWYHTGDLGRVDEDGYFYIVDRKKDMLIVGGINVYPREVEEVLYTHPMVAEAAVVGAPDALRGEQVVAVVALKPEGAITERELVAFCRKRLANYKVPRKVVFRQALPKGGTGKILKRLLRKEIELDAGS